jgi:outer membrane protein assembly factor BamB
VYFTADDGYLYCLEADDGKLLWKISGGPARRWVLGNDRLVSSWPARGAPVLHQGRIYFAASIWPFMGIFIHAVDPETGRIIWTNSGDGTNYVPQPHSGAVSFATVVPQGHLVADGNHLIVPGGRSTPAIYDATTGKLLHFAFDKRQGGHFVSAGRGAYFLAGKIYHAADGKPLGYGDPAVIEDDHVITTRGTTVQVNEFQGVVASSSTDRRGAKTQTASLSAKPLYHFKLEGGPDKVFLKAGPRIYTGGKGVVAAFEAARGETEGGARRPVWSTPIEGDVWNMLAADDRLFVMTTDARLYCFGGEAPAKVTQHRLAHDRLDEQRDEVVQRVADLLNLPNTQAGYAVVLSIGSGRLIEELLRQSKLYVIVVEPEARKVESLRRRMQAVGLYGRRLAAHVGDPATFEFPPYLANLVVAEDASAAGLDDMSRDGQRAVRHLFSTLRPYGGTACLDLSPEEHQRFAREVEVAALAGAKVQRDGRHTLLVREGPLPGSDAWTHQYGTAAQAGISDETLVKAPLGVLWFGGPAHDGVLPRHGHGPSPQVAGGRLIIEGPDLLRATDVYTGRLLWEKPLEGVGKYYDTTRHFPGAGEIGGNYVTLAERVYVVHGRGILELDTATGETLKKFALPGEPDGDLPHFGYLGVWDDLLVATAEPLDASLQGVSIPAEKKPSPKTATKPPPDEIPTPNVKPFDVPEPKAPTSGKKAKDDDDDDAPDSKPKTPSALPSLSDLLGLDRKPLEAPTLEPIQTQYGSGSRQLVVFNRHTGELLWSRAASQTFRHNTIVVAAGKVFCIDSVTEARRQALARRGIKLQGSAVLYALDARTGRVVWSTSDKVFATFLSYSEEHDVLLQAGSRYKDRARDEISRGMAALRGKDGTILWSNDLSHEGPCLFWRDQVITNGSSGFALDIKTGKPTGWKFSRAYGCNTAIGCQNLLTFRSGAAGYYDLLTDSGTGNIGGFRSGCTNNLIPADGVLSAPDYTRTCTCAYQNQTSLALVHTPEAEYWTFGATFREGQLGVNFGAPGDRRAPNGTLWVDFPSVGGPSKEVPVVIEPKRPDVFRLHASAVTATELPWIAASGIVGARRLTIKLADERPRRVNLHFCEPDADCDPGERRFDVSIQGEKVVDGLDVVKAAGGPRRGVVKSFRTTPRDGEIVIELAPLGPQPAIISGLEVLRE